MKTRKHEGYKNRRFTPSVRQRHGVRIIDLSRLLPAFVQPE
jgi:hypothetical protein